MNTQKGFAPIVIILVIVVATAIGSGIYVTKQNRQNTPSTSVILDKNASSTNEKHNNESEVDKTTEQILVDKTNEILKSPQSQSKQDAQLKIFETFLARTPVTEVYIGSYGGVSTETLNAIRDVIKEETGVKVTILGSYKEGLPKIKRLYSEERQQYDGDILWSYFQSLVDSKNRSVRYLYIVNDDLYTNLDLKRPYVFSRAFPDVNVAIMSMYRLSNATDISNAIADQELLKTRAKKLALRVLGITVGFSSSPSADNRECVMYQALILADLDKVGSKYCEPEKSYMHKVFAR